MIGFFPIQSLYFECYATMPMLADTHISILSYLWCKCSSLRAQSIKAKRLSFSLVKAYSRQDKILGRHENITKYAKSIPKKQKNRKQFVIFSVFSSMRPCRLGTRERSIFGTHTLAPARWRSKWCNVVLHVERWNRSCTNVRVLIYE